MIKCVYTYPCIHEVVLASKTGRKMDMASSKSKGCFRYGSDDRLSFGGSILISCVCDGAEHICTECLALVEEEE
jgi:hypothetical protein